MLNSSFQDGNGDGNPCGLETWDDEDFSEQFITDMVNTREMYLIPMLNVDGNRYDPRGILRANRMGELPYLWMEKESEGQHSHRRHPNPRC